MNIALSWRTVWRRATPCTRSSRPGSTGLEAVGEADEAPPPYWSAAAYRGVGPPRAGTDSSHQRRFQPVAHLLEERGVLRVLGIEPRPR